MATDVTAGTMIQSLFQLLPKNAIIPVPVMRMKYVVLHGDFQYTDQISSLIHLRLRPPRSRLPHRLRPRQSQQLLRQTPQLLRQTRQLLRQQPQLQLYQ